MLTMKWIINCPRVDDIVMKIEMCNMLRVKTWQGLLISLQNLDGNKDRYFRIECNFLRFNSAAYATKCNWNIFIQKYHQYHYPFGCSFSFEYVTTENCNGYDWDSVQSTLLPHLWFPVQGNHIEKSFPGFHQVALWFWLDLPLSATRLKGLYQNATQNIKDNKISASRF